MKRFIAAGALLLSLSLGKAASAADLEKTVAKAFAGMRGLRDMNPGQQYTLPIADKPVTGPKELFLRRRESAEILQSGLSCGCGDYAITFLRLMEAQGVPARMVDGADISTASLLNHFSGHAVVAVQDPTKHVWWLVNSTDRTVLSKNWSPKSQSFQAFNHTFWIGYNGPIAGYPARNADALQRFYTATLRKVPVSFLNQHLRRLNFSVDPSLRTDKGQFKNPHLASFLTLQSQVFQTYKVNPLQVVNVKLVRGKDDNESHIEALSKDQWRASLGLQSACSPSLLAYFEERVNAG